MGEAEAASGGSPEGGGVGIAAPAASCEGGRAGACCTSSGAKSQNLPGRIFRNIWYLSNFRKFGTG